jgi:transposase
MDHKQATAVALLEPDRQIQEIDHQVHQLSRQSSVCRRLEQVSGIGPIPATALEGTVGDTISTFKNGRQLAAFIPWPGAKPALQRPQGTLAGH